MPTLNFKIHIPEDGCKNCPHLRKTIIDHNYYGKFSIRYTCSIFHQNIIDYNRCSECLSAEKEAVNIVCCN